MGLDIFAISKARWVQDEDCDEDVDPGDPGYLYSVGRGRRNDGMRPGNYVVGKGGRTFSGWAGPYAAYHEWRLQLSLLALSAEPETVWANPRRFRGKPLVELIDFPDGGNCAIGPKTSAKLYQDFVALAPQAKKHFIEHGPTITPSIDLEPSRGGIPRFHLNQAGLVFTRQLARTVGGTVAAPPVEDRRWMLDAYGSFRGAFRTASDGGFVFFW